MLTSSWCNNVRIIAQTPDRNTKINKIIHKKNICSTTGYHLHSFVVHGMEKSPLRRIELRSKCWEKGRIKWRIMTWRTPSPTSSKGGGSNIRNFSISILQQHDVLRLEKSDESQKVFEVKIYRFFSFVLNVILIWAQYYPKEFLINSSSPLGLRRIGRESEAL